MTNDRERFLRFMRAMNTIDGEYAALMHGLRVKESLFVLHKEKLVTLTRKGRAYAESLLRPILDAEARIARTVLSDAFIAELETVGREAKTAFSSVGKTETHAGAEASSLNLESAR